VQNRVASLYCRRKDLGITRHWSIARDPIEAMCQPDSALAEKVIAVFADSLQAGADHPPEDDLLIDLGIDSLSMAEMTVLVEQIGGVRIPGDALLDARTVGDLVCLLECHSRPDPRLDSATP